MNFSRDQIIRIALIAAVIVAAGYAAFLHGPRTKNAELKSEQSKNPAAAQIQATADTLKAAEKALPATINIKKIAQQVRSRAKRIGVSAEVSSDQLGVQISATGSMGDLRAFMVEVIGQARLTPDNQLTASGPLLVPSGETVIEPQGSEHKLTLRAVRPTAVP